MLIILKLWCDHEVAHWLALKDPPGKVAPRNPDAWNPCRAPGLCQQGFDGNQFSDIGTVEQLECVPIQPHLETHQPRDAPGAELQGVEMVENDRPSVRKTESGFGLREWVLADVPGGQAKPDHSLTTILVGDPIPLRDNLDS